MIPHYRLPYEHRMNYPYIMNTDIGWINFKMMGKREILKKKYTIHILIEFFYWTEITVTLTSFQRERERES